VEDREFEIGGEVFRWIYPYWEDIAKVFDQDNQDLETNGDGVVADPTVFDTITDFIKRIELFIDPDFNDGVARWRSLTKRKKNPIPHSHYAELYRWLLETTSAPTPTEQLQPSEDGQQRIAAT
jgi:hypothetical protein